MKSDDDLIAEAAVGPLKPVHIAIEQACLHPLVRHAVIDDRGYVQWPHFTERQKQVAADTVRLIRVDGRQYFSMPPRVNADWFLPENPTPDDLRTIFGSTPDLQRWYLSIDLTAGARDTLAQRRTSLVPLSFLRYGTRVPRYRGVSPWPLRHSRSRQKPTEF